MDWKLIITQLIDKDDGPGMTLEQIGAHVGMSKGAVHDLKSGRGQTVVYETGCKLVDLHRVTMRRLKRRRART